MATKRIRWSTVGLALIPASAPMAQGQILFEDAKLTPPGIAAMEQFGHTVAIEGDLAVVGAVFDDFRGAASGSAFVFDASTGALVDRLAGSDTSSDDLFSDGLAVANGQVYVGAPRSDANGQLSGRAYVFGGPALNQIDRFDAERIVFVGEDPVGAVLGWSIDAGDGFIAIGSPGDVEGANGGGGAVYIYDEQTRSRIGKFFASDAGFADNMGRRVATAGGLVVASAPFDDDNGIDSGSVYVFDAATGDELAKLTASNGAADDLFGLGIAADGDLLAVGAPFADTVGDGSGVVYLFDLTTFEPIGTLLADTTAAGDRFGRSIGIDGGLIVVGADRADAQGDVSGAAYVFDRATHQQIATLLPSDGESGDVFGNAVAVSGNRVLVGAEGDDDLGDFAGAAYLFTVDIQPCLADVNNDGLATPADFNAWILAFNNQDPACDQNSDGLCTPADFNAWIVNFNAGC